MISSMNYWENAKPGFNITPKLGLPKIGDPYPASKEMDRFFQLYDKWAKIRKDIDGM